MNAAAGQMPAVSVVIPTFNRRHLVGDAVESALAQTWRDREIIVIDDGSSDGTAEYLRERFGERIRLIVQENGGISCARNRGISEARGSWVAFLDSDDKWLPRKLETQMSWIEEHPEVRFLCSRFRAYEIGREDQLRFGPDDFSDRFEDLLASRNFIPTSTVMVHGRCFAEVGAFDSSIPTFEDFDLWLRLAARYPYDCVPEILVEYREHPQNISKNKPKLHEGLLRVYQNILHRFPDRIPQLSLYRMRLSAYMYLHGSELCREGRFREGSGFLRRAVVGCPSFFLYFVQKGDGWMRVPFLAVKTYVWLALCQARALLSRS